MTIKQSIRLGIGIHLILLNLVIIEWVLFWNELSPVSRIGFAVVSLAVALSLTNKVRFLLNGGSPNRRLTYSLLAFTLLSIDWFLFQSKDVQVLTEFSLAVFILEFALHGVFHKVKSIHLTILLTNLFLLLLLRIYPNLAQGIVQVSTTVSEFFKVEALLCWIVCASVLAYVLSRKEQISKNYRSDNESEWYGNLFSLISHNIRTPLASILQNIEIIKLRSKDGQFYLNESLIKRMEESSIRANKLVDGLLKKSTLVKLQTEEQTSMEVFLNHWAAENTKVIVTTSTWIRNKNLSKTEQLSFSIALDSIRDNSIQAGAKNIHVYSKESDVLCIVDDGKGMSNDDISNYGQPISHSKNGAGLGTFFAREILGNSGWTLDALPMENGAHIVIKDVSELQVESRLSF